MNPEDNAPLAVRRTESIKCDNLLINYTTEFRRIWDSSGSRSNPAAFWRPTPNPELLPGYFPLGDVAATGHQDINEKRVVMVVCEGDQQSGDSSKGLALKPPIDFEQVWRDTGSGAKADCSIWRPIPPDGYVALGQVSSNGRDRPSLNSVRCVRADLVAPSFISDLIWNDKGSGAKQSFSAWGIYPPHAQAGEIYFAPGTFVGVGTYNKPATHITAYSLRMQIPLQESPPPVAPVLLGNEQPLTAEPAKITYIAKLPWFTVRDPQLRPLEQLHTSPFYRLERTDQYVLIGYANNQYAVSQTFKWSTNRPQSTESLDGFSRATSIVVDGQWPARQPSLFSARLNTRFAHTEPSDSWNGPAAAAEVVTIVAKNKTVAAYELQSTYRLLRANNTQVPAEVSYIDGNSLYLAEYPPAPDIAADNLPAAIDTGS
ncbi:Vps62-related protein [Pseudomonas umsongensis]|uniref:Vps62-related protein n=1 Tax=Pseudomonas umsongensis TaxID=198618 RepID=UPI00200A4009|nr:Vps62-related protein [Pseudomonas umsongensis]MCK8657170.1 Vps62-related protein [Pseudomonas umsongensis]